MIAASFDLIVEALIASGIEKVAKMDEYLEKFEVLMRKVMPCLGNLNNPEARARNLFEWLWREKPRRYESRGKYRLNEVLDAQLSADAKGVGNCLGLTLLYNCLLRKMGIQAGALHLEYAFNVGPHVLTLLPAGEREIEVENILPDGFDFQGHLDNPGRVKWGDCELVADIYLSCGNEFFEKKEWSQSLKSYEKAISLHPTYEKAHLNKAILLDKVRAMGSTFD
jgi:tetratricopeptide (TPR) repeat protein